MTVSPPESSGVLAAAAAEAEDLSLTQLRLTLTQKRLAPAAADLRYLLDRGYPREASLTLVGNRYELPRAARELLHRGVLAAAVAAARRAKRLFLSSLAGRPLALDGHNVLITVESALRGWPLVAADDGWLRDIGQRSRRYRPSAYSRQALELVSRRLAAAGVGLVLARFDAPLSGSGELAAATRALLEAYQVPVESEAVPVPEKELLAAGFPVATSDGALIEAAPAAMDLAGEVISSLPNVWVVGLAEPPSPA